MTILTGNAALASDVAAINALATSASTAASVATANAASALANSVAAQATAAAAEALAAVALSIPALPVVTSAVSTTLVAIGQGSSTVAVSLSNLLGGETIDLLSAAAAASDTDTFMVGQGTNILTRQTFAAVWAYLQGKLPNYKFPVQEITASKTIDATYNGQILVVTGPGVTLTPNYTLMGTGFECEIVTSGSGSVIWGAGITATNAGVGLTSANQYARLIAFTSSAGNVVLASVGGSSSGGGSVAAPGPVTGLTLGAITAASLALSWTAPATGGAATYYVVQYRVYGSGSTWTALGPNPTAASATITGLSSGTQYDIEVAANNSGGVASSFVVYGQVPVATTSAAAPPGAPTGLAANNVSSVSFGLTWNAPTTGSAVASYSVQSSLHGANAWATLSPAPTTTSATVSGLASAAYYDFQVAGVTSGGTVGAYDQLLNLTTLPPTAYAPNAPGSVATGTITSSSVALNWAAPAADGSHSTASSYLLAYSSNAGSTYSTPVNAGNVTTYSFIGLTPSTAYVFKVAASNASGNSAYVTASATTSAASGSGAPNVVTALAAGTVTSYTVPLSWTAPAVDSTHGAATAYTVQYRLNGSGIWLTATSAATSPSYTLAGLIAGQTYQFNVFGTNASGASAGATITATPTASGLAFANWGTGGYPPTMAHGSTNNAFVAFLAAGTNIASIQFGYSATGYDVPSSLQAGTAYTSTVYGSLGATAPATAGTYYGWMLFYDTAGDCIFAVAGAAGQAVAGGASLTTGAMTVT